ncbi:phospholipase A and acyltransferase 4-like [Mastacembelus armatus]|uniref:Phospholipase A and acyltransferase 4-like n=1 Tax=Mastacembelus armatus TaxID=205130 RepID=A0A7N9B1Y2_9TELE|nr:phospholipase A and acyltransferase 4-like [Mastacembelus armatus]
MEPKLDAKPGDLIEIFRGAYEHWAIYIGGNEVVHLVSSNSDSGPLELLTILDRNIAEVKREKVWDVVDSDKFHINNLLDHEYEPRERHIIVRNACRMVGRHLRYHVASYNCEHFVTELRYGKPESRQVKDAAVIGGAAVAGLGLVVGAALLVSLFKDNNKNKDHQ